MSCNFVYLDYFIKLGFKVVWIILCNYDVLHKLCNSYNLNCDSLPLFFS